MSFNDVRDNKERTTKRTAKSKRRRKPAQERKKTRDWLLTMFRFLFFFVFKGFCFSSMVIHQFWVNERRVFKKKKKVSGISQRDKEAVENTDDMTKEKYPHEISEEFFSSMFAMWMTKGWLNFTTSEREREKRTSRQTSNIYTHRMKRRRRRNRVQYEWAASVCGCGGWCVLIKVDGFGSYG